MLQNPEPNTSASNEIKLFLGDILILQFVNDAFSMKPYQNLHENIHFQTAAH